MTAKKHPQRHQDRRRLWGRAKGKALSAYQKNLMENLLPQVSIPAENPLAGLNDYTSISLEIGFGGGEHLLHCAGLYSDHCFLGAEPFVNGVAKALTGIEKRGVSNIRLHHGDARKIMETLPEASLDAIYILYPDPWPKPRHYKRRLIEEEFIADVHRILKPGGRLYFASDIISYIDWALARILRSGKFSWDMHSASDWLTPYDNWPSTRYEAKALREGRTPHYFTFIKV